MRPSHRTQPYRKQSATRQQGPSLAAMLRGRTGFGQNPMDEKRRRQHLEALRRKRLQRPF